MCKNKNTKKENNDEMMLVLNKFVLIIRMSNFDGSVAALVSL